MKKSQRSVLLFLIGIVSLLGLAACSSTGSPAVQQGTQPVPVEGSGMETEAVSLPASPTPESARNTVEPTTGALPVEPTDAPTLMETEPGEAPTTEQAAAPPVKQGLEATDPSTVQLASGEVQLVEFFAFW
jgi:outer membrane biosynthesis protein TonB